MSSPMIRGLTAEALALRFRSTEHDFVERKSRSDKSGRLQTAVAFATSAPIGENAFLFVRVADDGVLQEKPDKLEDLQKTVSSSLDQAYPPIERYFVPLVREHGPCLAVVVPGSESRPHFAGKPYIRVGRRQKQHRQSSSLL